LLDKITWGNPTLDTVMLVLAFIGIVIAFSIDFLYSYAAIKYYTWKLFISDLAIVCLLLLASRALIEGVTTGHKIWLFYLSYVVIHLIFIIWDLLLLDKKFRKNPMILYDFIGLIISITGLIFFRNSIIAAIIILWACSISYLIIGWKSIIKIVEKEV
jgi:hypothetical protein